MRTRTLLPQRHDTHLLAKISSDAIRRLLFSPSFTGTYERLRVAHGMALPLVFPSVLAELNLLALLSLLNFASGYRVPLHAATGRGAFDSIRAFVFSLYISSSVGGEGDLLSARGMQSVAAGKVAELMGVADKVHVDQPSTVPGVTMSELGGPVWEVVQLVTKVLKETGDVLVNGGYQDLGAFVLEALKEGDKVRRKNEPGREDPECDVIIERLVKAIPAFRDMVVIDGQPVYCFKKAMLTLHAIALRYKDSPNASVPVPRTDNLPVFSDNVIPSMLVHLGVIDLSTSTPAVGLQDIFPLAKQRETLDLLLGTAPPQSENTEGARKGSPKEGPVLTTEQAFVLRAAAVDACELIVQYARNLSDEELRMEDGRELRWLKTVTVPELDAWAWAVAKDRADYRSLERFVLRNTTYF
ncbi:uncharacterized protein PHACADRAFT_122814 [Phanerochaete carnosa HHB-10118-sp]|uniref:Queuosine 5'-phosphate N-glycosylase/hydrolase n=1 Tax=Phanerochaete carnosa (strain HHB-10118-sp) TaxID=650164 RepID=K5VRG2_PHACS|nr:uncharacterized protein PHACADRAFT_122814 [Phanerochaete carnosa HHB-10118-sp]EKM54088.1 hypothetical protein PHACADRAFT_122814 [Phanerochaete carnosa HHB-10118-sp]